MLALRLCLLLLLWVWACPAQETDPDAATRAFIKQYIDYPGTLNLPIDEYCNQMMKERELTDRKLNTFIRAPYEDIEDACMSDGEEQTGLRLIGENVTATTCAAKKNLTYQDYYDNYCIRFLYPNPVIECVNGVPVRPNDLVVGFFD